MPPRITRNSDRPRASNRTMVDTQIPGPACPSLRLDRRRHHRKMKATDMANKPQRTLSSESRGTLTGSGLDLETKIFSASGRGGNFFLTSLFIELIELSTPTSAGYPP